MTVDAPAIPPSRPAGEARDAAIDSLRRRRLAWTLRSPYARCRASCCTPPARSSSTTRTAPGAAGSQLVPEVAQSLPTPLADGRTYTFTIRRGLPLLAAVDQPVTAQTFKYTIERTLNPRMKSPVADEYRDIVGAAAYMAGKTDHIAGVVARRRHADDPPDRARARPTRRGSPNPSSAPSRPTRRSTPKACAVIPSAGPYYVAVLHAGSGHRPDRNPNYHGNRPHRLARIELTVGVPPQRAVAEVEAGTADYAARRRNCASADVARSLAALRPGQPSGQRRSPAVLRQPVASSSTSSPSTPTGRCSPTCAPPSRQLRDRPAPPSPASATVRPAARAPDRPLPASRHPRLPRPARLPAHPGPGQSADARHRPRRAQPPCSTHATSLPVPEQAQIVKTDLAAIGLQRPGQDLPDRHAVRQDRHARRAVRHRLGRLVPDYLDPDAMLNLLLEDEHGHPRLRRPDLRAATRRRARLTGPERYLAYAGSTPTSPATPHPGRVRQPLQPRLLLRPHRLPDLRASTAWTSPRSASARARTIHVPRRAITDRRDRLLPWSQPSSPRARLAGEGAEAGSAPGSGLPETLGATRRPGRGQAPQRHRGAGDRASDLAPKRPPDRRDREGVERPRPTLLTTTGRDPLPVAHRRLGVGGSRLAMRGKQGSATHSTEPLSCLGADRLRGLSPRALAIPVNPSASPDSMSPLLASAWSPQQPRDRRSCFGSSPARSRS